MRGVVGANAGVAVVVQRRPIPPAMLKLFNGLGFGPAANGAGIGDFAVLGAGGGRDHNALVPGVRLGFGVRGVVGANAGVAVVVQRRPIAPVVVRQRQLGMTVNVSAAVAAEFARGIALFGAGRGYGGRENGVDVILRVKPRAHRHDCAAGAFVVFFAFGHAGGFHGHNAAVPEMVRIVRAVDRCVQKVVVAGGGHVYGVPFFSDAQIINDRKAAAVFKSGGVDLCYRVGHGHGLKRGAAGEGVQRDLGNAGGQRDRGQGGAAKEHVGLYL